MESRLRFLEPSLAVVDAGVLAGRLVMFKRLGHSHRMRQWMYLVYASMSRMTLQY